MSKNVLSQDVVEYQVGKMEDLNLSMLQMCVHSSSYNAGWWEIPDMGGMRDPHEGPTKLEWLELVTPTKIALIHSEVSEAMEGFRKSLMDDHLPHRTMAEVELADVIIRVLDLAGAHDMDLMGAVKEKLQYNWQRADHKIEAREAENGKKF